MLCIWLGGGPINVATLSAPIDVAYVMVWYILLCCDMKCYIYIRIRIHIYIYVDSIYGLAAPSISQPSAPRSILLMLWYDLGDEAPMAAICSSITNLHVCVFQTSAVSKHSTQRRSKHPWLQHPKHSQTTSGSKHPWLKIEILYVWIETPTISHHSPRRQGSRFGESLVPAKRDNVVLRYGMSAQSVQF